MPGLYAKQTNLENEQFATFLVERTGDPARSEIQAQLGKDPKDPEEIFKALSTIFWATETVASLQQEFYSRHQSKDETLTEYSRELILIYGRLVEVAEEGDQRNSLSQLKDQALIEQFTNGLKERTTQQEAERLALKYKGKSFADFRTEILGLFRRMEHKGTTQQQPITEAAIKEAYIELDKKIDQLTGVVNEVRGAWSRPEQLMPPPRNPLPNADRGRPGPPPRRNFSQFNQRGRGQQRPYGQAERGQPEPRPGPRDHETRPPRGRGTGLPPTWPPHCWHCLSTDHKISECEAYYRATQQSLNYQSPLPRTHQRGDNGQQ